jgi:ribonuclease-3
VTKTNINFYDLEIKLGVKFKNLDLLRIALTHPSATNEMGIKRHESNQRMEFFGDAVLDLIVANYLYDQHDEWNEGELTVESDKLVNGATLAKIAAEINLGRYLILGKGLISQSGRDNPSILAAAFEAVVAAVFIEGGYEIAHNMVVQLYSKYLYALEEVKNSKKYLQEYLQSQGRPIPEYRTVESVGKPHDLTFFVEVVIDKQVMGAGSGSKKIDAEQQAATNALKALKH